VNEPDTELPGNLPALVPQPHGGAIYGGGVPGHRGGPGRPPSALRERLRGSFEQRIAVLENIADDLYVVHERADLRKLDCPALERSLRCG